MSNKKTNVLRIIIDIFVILNFIAFVSLGIFTYYQNEKINNLNRSTLQNDILISSTLEDTDQKTGKMIELPIKVESNFPGWVPIYIELLDITKEGKSVRSDYHHSWVSKQEDHIQADGEIVFFSNITIDKAGIHELSFKIYYNYDKEKGIKYGGQKIYDFSISFIN